ncbi:MAG: Calx-beta domain-containing protein [Fuerstiella sp.]
MGSDFTYIPIETFEDLLDEPDETFRILLTAASAGLIANGSAVGTVIDNDQQQEQSFSISIMDDIFREGAGAVSGRLQSSQPVTQDVTVTLSAISGSAEEGADFELPLATTTIQQGAQQGVFQLTILDDAITEGIEDFQIVIDSVSSGTIADPVGNFQIYEAEPVGGDLQISIDDQAFREDNSPERKFRIWTSQPVTEDLTVDFAMSPISTAPIGSPQQDLIYDTGTLTIPAGSDEVQLPVTIIHDSMGEQDEQFQVVLSSPSAGVLKRESARGTIYDDTGSQLEVSIHDSETSEGSDEITPESVPGYASFAVTVNQQLSGPLHIHYEVRAATADETDVELESGRLTLTPETGPYGRILVPIIDDDIAEETEHFTVNITLVSKGTTADDTATGTILDDDDDDGNGGDVEVSIRLLQSHFLEGPYSHSFKDRAQVEIRRTDTRGNNELEPGWVDLKFSGTAKFGVDYTILSEQAGGVAPGAASANLALNSPNGVDVFYVVSLMDEDFEEPEQVIIEITQAAQSLTVKSGSRVTATLKDATADLNIGVDHNAEDETGAPLQWNNDDDNGDWLMDNSAQIHMTQDDDLRPLVIEPAFQPPTDVTPHNRLSNDLPVPTRSHFLLNFSQNLRITDTDGTELTSGQSQIAETDSATTYYIDGIGLGPGTITVQWVAVVDAPGTPEDGQTVFSRVFDTANYMVWGVDLDIDSDNNNGVAEPDHSAWEEYLEADEYGIGKMIVNHDDQPERTPVTLQLPPGLDAGDTSIKVILSWQEESGFLNLYDGPQPGALSLNNAFNPSSTTRRLSLSELGYESTTGATRTIWLEGFGGIYHQDKVSVDEFGKPDDRLKVQLAGTESPWPLSDEVKYMVVLPDSFYPALHEMPEIRSAFAAEMVYGERGDDGSSDPAATPVDDPRWGLRLLTKDELRRLLESAFLDSADERDKEYIKIVLDNLFKEPHPTSSKVAGIGAAVYLDHVSGNLVLAYRGTNFTELIDWMQNIAQGLNGYSPQYQIALRISYAMAQASTYTPWNPRLEITGHSLGGGLASAGAIAAGVHATTFNAAGLYGLETFLDPDDNRYVYSGSDDRYANARDYVTRYAVATINTSAPGGYDVPDVLTWLQHIINVQVNHRDALPSAVGLPQALEGLSDFAPDEKELFVILSEHLATEANWATVLWKALPYFFKLDLNWEDLWDVLAFHVVRFNSKFDLSSLKGLFTKMGDSHAMEHILHGLMTRRSLTTHHFTWNVYDKELGSGE